MGTPTQVDLRRAMANGRRLRSEAVHDGLSQGKHAVQALVHRGLRRAARAWHGAVFTSRASTGLK
ncbi:MAG: hypothetical protein AAF318_09710 [Pseudomonadota bacterium]